MRNPCVWLLMLGMLACNQNNEYTGHKSTVGKVALQPANTIPPELSIYNLPSKWVSQNNKELGLKDLRGKVVVMAMIYSSCQTACPRLIADMRNIENHIPKEDLGQMKFVLVSIDPATDTPQHLKEFTETNNLMADHWMFLRGSIEDTRVLANTLAVKYKEISPMNFSHSNIISVLDESGVLVHQKEGLNLDYKATIKAINEELNN